MYIIVPLCELMKNLISLKKPQFWMLFKKFFPVTAESSVKYSDEQCKFGSKLRINLNPDKMCKIPFLQINIESI